MKLNIQEVLLPKRYASGSNVLYTLYTGNFAISMELNDYVFFINFLQLNLHRSDDYYIELVNQLFTADVGILNRNLLLCIFWSLLRSFNEAANHNKLVSDLREHPHFVIGAREAIFLRKSLDFNFDFLYLIHISELLFL